MHALFPSSQLKIADNTVISNNIKEAANKSSDVDIVHLQSLYHRCGIDIFLNAFTLINFEPSMLIENAYITLAHFSLLEIQHCNK